jgi:integrase
MARLTARMVEQTNVPGTVPDGGGLYLQVTAGRDGLRKSWLVRYTAPDGKRRERGLGAIGDVSLKQARERAVATRTDAAKGIDPLAERDARKAEARKLAARSVTFSAMAEAYIAAHEAGWINPKHRQQWRNTLATYALPVMGDLPVADIDQQTVLAAIGPLWTNRTETASRLRGRIEAILDYARVMGHRTGENPAAWRGHLALVLPGKRKVAPVRHHPSVPWGEVQTLWTELQTREGSGAACLAFAILTAARSGEVRGVTWGEIDFATRVWRVPAARMKAKRVHAVPLSQAALAALTGRRALARDLGPRALVFASDMHPDRPISDATLGAVLRRMGRTETAHGFRSTFRTWAMEATNFPRELAEIALAHAVGNAVEQAYARGSALDRRRDLMEAWARFVSGLGGAEVVPLRQVGGE